MEELITTCPAVKLQKLQLAGWEAGRGVVKTPTVLWVDSS